MNTTAQIKQAVKKSGQQIVQEPLELLKTARDQVSGEEFDRGERYEDPAEVEAKRKQQETEQLKQKVAFDDQRHLEALQNEMRDIRHQKIFNDLIARIQSGENVAVEEFQELTHEQREVLKAQREAAIQRQAAMAQQQDGLREPTSKRDRRIGGQKKTAEKQQTRVEKPVPPSG